MRYYLLDGVQAPRYSAYYVAESKWYLPGVHCPLCNAIWGGLMDSVAVETALRLIDSGRPPHRSQRAELPHWALASDSDVKTYCCLA